MRHLLPVLLLSTFTVPALAAEPARGPLVSLTTSAQRLVANDVAQATLYVETSGSDAGKVAAHLDQVTDTALKTAKRHDKVKVESGNRNSWPLYDKNNKQTGWRGRAELRLESRDVAALSKLISALSPELQFAGLSFSVSPQARDSAENALIPEALTAFKARAEIAARALGYRNYRVVEVSLNSGGGFRPVAYRAKAMSAAVMADAAGPEMASGESELTVSAQGQIELQP